jgi:hypothetical protein
MNSTSGNLFPIAQFCFSETNDKSLDGPDKGGCIRKVRFISIVNSTPFFLPSCENRSLKGIVQREIAGVENGISQEVYPLQ